MQIEFLTLSELLKLINAVGAKKRKYSGNIYRHTYNAYASLLSKLMGAHRVVIEIGEPEVVKPLKKSGKKKG